MKAVLKLEEFLSGRLLTSFSKSDVFLLTLFTATYFHTKTHIVLEFTIIVKNSSNYQDWRPFSPSCWQCQTLNLDKEWPSYCIILRPSEMFVSNIPGSEWVKWAWRTPRWCHTQLLFWYKEFHIRAFQWCIIFFRI